MAQASSIRVAALPLSRSIVVDSRSRSGTGDSISTPSILTFSPSCRPGIDRDADGVALQPRLEGCDHFAQFAGQHFGVEILGAAAGKGRHAVVQHRPADMRIIGQHILRVFGVSRVRHRSTETGPAGVPSRTAPPDRAAPLRAGHRPSRRCRVLPERRAGSADPETARFRAAWPRPGRCACSTAARPARRSSGPAGPRRSAAPISWRRRSVSLTRPGRSSTSRSQRLG